LMGRVSALQVRDRLRKSDVFLLPSLSEGISNALLEAMACGLPVIATDCGGICEVLTDNVEGLIVPVCDSNSISHSLRYLYKNRDLMNKMGDAGRKRVEQNFTLDQQSEKFLKLYSSLVRNSPDVFNDSFGVRE
jgi:colanic acid/amylovoran biosynthesis glycosyltransferase